MVKPIIRIEEVTKEIDHFHLGPINLHIQPGTVTALIGNNGSGKSTLLKLIMNLVKRDTGCIKVFDKDVDGNDEDWKKHIAYQPQTLVGYNGFTGEALKELTAFAYPDWDEKLFTTMTQLLNIPLTEKFERLSQGVQQKLSLALTIASNTKILILDEPTSFIDIPSKQILINLLVDWMETGDRSIIIASHQAEDIQKLSDYLYVLYNGKEVEYFEKEQLTEQYRRYFIRENIPKDKIPGEILREDFTIISNQPAVTERFLSEEKIKWSDQKTIDFEDIITILLTKREEIR